MKKTLTINLNNIVFHIDDDAYEMLQTYLTDVERHLSEDERKEVMNDIEARIAELLNERLQKSKNVVNIEDVEEIINILGKPSQYSDDEEDEKETQSTKSEKKRARRFYRDPENSILGGVGGGIAAYFSWDVTWVRIALVVLAMISAGYMIPIYLLVWIVAPNAVTVSQRLEMQGEDVTVESIKNEINNVKNYVESDKFKDTANNMGNKFADVIKIIFKVFFGFLGTILGIVGVIVIVTLLIALMLFIFQPGMFNNCSPAFMADWSLLSPDNVVLLFISLILVVGGPIFMLIHWAIRIISGRQERSKTTFWVVFILWIAGIFMLYSVSAKTLVNWNKNNVNSPWVFNWDNDENSTLKDEVRQLDQFDKIEISGNIELELQQDSLKNLTISAPENLMTYIKTEVNDGKLKIYTDKIFLNHRIKVIISNDSIFELEANGASKVESMRPIKTSKLFLSLSGASQADIDVNVENKMTSEVSGASSAKLKGVAGSVDIEANGASKIEADQLKATHVKVETSGASHAKVFATESIDADASGASRIDCTGSPRNIKKSENMGSSIEIR